MVITKLFINTDIPVHGIPNPISFDFGLSEYELEDYEDTITGVIEPIASGYSEIVELIGVNATARIELPSQCRFGQWRVAVMSVDLQDGTLVVAITNKGTDQKSMMLPVFGKYNPKATSQNHVV